MEPKFHSPVTTHLLLMDDFCNPPETEKAKTREMMMSEKGKGKVVCVTEASGYIASWLVKLLLQHGYTVRATVRDPNDPKKTEHLRMLDGAKERLHLFKAELMEEGSFDSVVDGCDGVFHTASPVTLSPNDPQTEMIEPAVKGTLNVLTSCAKVPTIKRVILTSSVVSVTYTGKPLTPDVVVDETWFSDPAFCESNKLWYQLSKTLAEDAAWNFAKENGTDVVTLHPGFVLGPLLLPSINYSTELFLNIINGVLNPTASGIYGFVDVRDVASAHILALERSSANGRYLLIGRVAHISEVAKILHEHFPRLHFPEKLGGEKPLLAHGMSKEKAETLGLSFTPLEVSVTDTIKSLQEKNLLDV